MNRLTPLNPAMIKKLALWCILGVFIGGMSGAMSTLFHHSVKWAIDFRKANSWMILLLPLIGCLVVWFYQQFGKEIEKGNDLIIDEIHEPKKTIPLRMVPMIFLGTVISHLFGASVGREGAAVQMSSALSDQFSKYINPIFKNRRLILMMGMSAGFASIFGTPLSGAIFGFEILFIGTLVYDALLPCLVAAIVGHYTALLLGVTHSYYFHVETLPLSAVGLLSSIAAGVIFGYAAKFFSWSFHKIKYFLNENFKNKLFQPLFAGSIIILVYFTTNSDRYLNLGEEVITSSFTQHVYPWDFLAKSFMTSLSLAGGFKGGEVTSLFYIGATLGNTLSYILPMDYPVLAALGFVSVFAGAANTPIAGVILAFELFGSGIGVYASLAIVVSYIFSGKSGIYHSQRTHTDKSI